MRNVSIIHIALHITAEYSHMMTNEYAEFIKKIPAMEICDYMIRFIQTLKEPAAFDLPKQVLTEYRWKKSTLDSENTAFINQFLIEYELTFNIKEAMQKTKIRQMIAVFQKPLQAYWLAWLDDFFFR